MFLHAVILKYSICSNYQVDIPANDQMQVRVGDHIGWMWKKYGVVSFDWRDGDDHGHYCEKKTWVENVGDSVSLQENVNDYRKYSIRFLYCCECIFIITIPQIMLKCIYRLICKLANYLFINFKASLLNHLILIYQKFSGDP